MVKGYIPSQLRSLIASILEKLGIDLYELEYRKEANGQILRVYIDTVEGVSIETCSLATRAIKDIIDTQGDFDYDYLEVSSPGIDRVLRDDKDFVRFQGARVLVKTTQVMEGQKKFIGVLVNADQYTLNLEIEGNLLPITRDIISIVRLHPNI